MSKVKNICILFMTFLIFVFNVTSVQLFCEETDTGASVFDVNAQNAVIINADSGTVLFSKNADSPFFCGFLPRLMTCILLVESGLDMNTEVTITKEMMSISHEKSSAELYAGNKITLYDLMRSAIVGNSQEACLVIAYFVSGGITDFIVAMNQRARELGAENTIFTNVTGMYSSGTKQQTTAHDIAKICVQALKLDYIETISNERVIQIRVSGNLRALYAKNSMIDKYSQYYNNKASGLAVSGNSSTGYALASVAVDKTMRLISVAYTNETIASLYADVSSMINFSLKEYSYRVLIQKNAPVKEISVVFGKERDYLTLVAENTISVSLPSSVSTSDILTELVLPELVDAPIKKGTVLGTVTYYFEGQVCGVTNLVAQTDISLDMVALYSSKINEFFSNKYLWAAIIAIFIAVIFYSTLVFILNKKRLKREQSKKRDRITRGIKK